MGDINLSDYKNLYLQTAKEYMDKISVSLSQLSKDVLNKEAIKNLHIASHSLKSQSQVMGYGDIADLCMGIEKISNDALQGVNQLNNEAILNIKKEVEKLGGMLDKPA